MADMVASVPELTKRIFSTWGKARNHNLGQIGFGGGRGSETGPLLGCGGDRFRHTGRGVTEDQRPPGAHIIDVPVFVGIPKMRSLPANDKRRVASDRTKGAHRRTYTAGNHLLGAFLQLA